MTTLTPDRSTQPSFGKIGDIRLIEAQAHRLTNDIPVYSIHAGTQDVVKVEFLFPAGSWYESKRLVASTANALITEGTQKHTASEVAEALDGLGAHYQSVASGDWASFQLYTLTRYLGQALDVVKEVLSCPVFPEQELNLFRQNKKQSLAVNNERVEYIAQKKINELLYGSAHPYGYYPTAADYDALDRDTLVAFHKAFYHAGACTIIISGKADEHAIALLNKCIGGTDWEKAPFKKDGLIVSAGTKEKKHFIRKEKAVQSAIRIGKVLFNKTHPDFHGMQVLCTILGGYFGSRLMANIREDKGFTYGIGSGLVSHKHSGNLIISTEVGVEVCNRAIDEIYSEINRLRSEPVPTEELELVRNYILGSFLRSIDGPFALAEKFKGIMTYGLGYDYYSRFIETVKTISSEKLMELASTYLQEDSMTELVVGEK